MVSLNAQEDWSSAQRGVSPAPTDRPTVPLAVASLRNGNGSFVCEEANTRPVAAGDCSAKGGDLDPGWHSLSCVINTYTTSIESTHRFGGATIWMVQVVSIGELRESEVLSPNILPKTKVHLRTVI